MTTRFPLALIPLLLALLAVPVRADAVPQSITVEGALRATGGGAAADGDYIVTFSLHDAAKGGKELWKEGPVTLKLVGGAFQYVLGATQPLDAKVLAPAGVWFQVKIGSEPPLGRVRLQSVAYAVRAGVAGKVECSGCIGGKVLANGSVSAAKVGFAYAGAADGIKGGAAAEAKIAANLKCTGCVSATAEVAWDGDIDLKGKALSAGKLVSGGDIVAKGTVSASTFVGDGSKLTGIKTAAGTCSTKGEVVKGIKADGTLLCIPAVDPSALPADGLDEISNGLLSNQFTDEIFGTKNLPIDDNKPVGTSDSLQFPDIGIAQQLDVLVSIQNADIGTIQLSLVDPKGTKYLLYDKSAKGKVLTGTWPSTNKTLTGDLSKWVGANPKGTWTLKVVDSGYHGNKKDGQIVSWSVKIRTLSNKKVAAKGVLRMPGGAVLQSVAKAPVTCSPANVGYFFYNPKDRTLQVCNGKQFDLVETLPGGIGGKGKPGKSCKDIKTQDKGAKDGLYWVDPDGATGAGGKYQTWCDMTHAAGGWVLVMQIQSGTSTVFGYGSGHWSSGSTLNSVGPQSLSNTNAKYSTFNTFKTTDGQLMLRDKSTNNYVVLEIPGMKGKTLLDRFQSLGGKKSTNNPGTVLKWISGKGSPQELMGFAKPTTMCSQQKVMWRMNMLSTHSGVRIGNDVATNSLTTNNKSSWPCYDNKTNLSYSGVGGTLESGRQWQDSYGSEALNRYRDNAGRGQGSHRGVELYVR